MPATPTFRRKQVYHSDLRSKSPLRIPLLAHPRASKFADRLPFCRFSVQGEDGTYELQAENEAVGRTLAQLPLRRIYHGGLREMKQWRTVGLSTGEFGLSDVVHDTGHTARIFSFQGAVFPEGSRSLVLEIERLMREHYGHAGPRMIRHLLQGGNQIVREMREHHRETADRLL